MKSQMTKRLSVLAAAVITAMVLTVAGAFQ
ncbi:hypothetical protein FHX48_002772 [Microbacterium halimionae]|uniref:Uncharacterized protein n=1 Tax=Microbacterium halimionae TaxID=1526413 RepID=A0A7W3JRG6_9MICO|nr:hypothetical protein [Microbacterium halimionae]NII94754.1 hypothetical protein [Microbacterium halimionae]